MINRGWVSKQQINPNTREKGQIDDVIELKAVVRKGEHRPQFMPKMPENGKHFLFK